MSEIITKTISIPCSAGVEVIGDVGTTTTGSHNYEARRRGSQTPAISGDAEKVAVISAGFNGSYGSFLWPASKATITVTQVKLEFWYYNNNVDEPIKKIIFFETDPIASITNWATWYGDIENATIYKTQEIYNLGKTQSIIELGSDSSDSICRSFTTRIRSAVANDHEFSVAIRRSDFTTSEWGSIFIGGETLVGDTGNGWRAANLDEISSPARFIIGYSHTQDSPLSQFYFRYTTDDPTDSGGQQTPENSIGGYIAPNDVYVSTLISDPISKSQITIPLASGSDEPPSSGLAQVGSEIIRYTSENNDNLYGLTRSIFPSSSFAAVVTPHADIVRYLDIDRIFNKNPVSGVSQYRCIAVLHESSDNMYVDDVKIQLKQNLNTNTTIDVGIEVPKFDVHSGTFYEDMLSGSNIFESADLDGSGYDTGFFEGAYMIINPSASANGVLVDSFDINLSGRAEFIIDRTLSIDVIAGTYFRIVPAPSQSSPNDITRPNENSGRFLGFIGEGGQNSIGYAGIRERGGRMNNHELFYIWIKRSIKQNSPEDDSSGAMLILEFNESSRY
jgi:hypothetical protein